MSSTAGSEWPLTVLRSVVVGSAALVLGWMTYRVSKAPTKFSVRPGINAPFADDFVWDEQDAPQHGSGHGHSHSHAGGFGSAHGHDHGHGHAHGHGHRHSPPTGAEAFLERFETESREIYNRKAAILAALSIPRGAHVADLGAGTGLFIESLTSLVGTTGRVWALDPFNKFVTYLKERVAKMDASLRSVICVEQNQETDMGPGLTKQPHSLDLVLSTDSYHHYEHPFELLSSVHSALKPSGRLAILDFDKDPAIASSWVMGHVRATKQQVRKEVESCGFEFVQDLKVEAGLKENYLMIFKPKST